MPLFGLISLLVWHEWSEDVEFKYHSIEISGLRSLLMRGFHLHQTACLTLRSWSDAVEMVNCVPAGCCDMPASKDQFKSVNNLHSRQHSECLNRSTFKFFDSIVNVITSACIIQGWSSKLTPVAIRACCSQKDGWQKQLVTWLAFVQTLMQWQSWWKSFMSLI